MLSFLNILLIDTVDLDSPRSCLFTRAAACCWVDPQQQRGNRYWLPQRCKLHLLLAENKPSTNIFEPQIIFSSTHQNGGTPLSGAALEDHYDVALFLIGKGADINLANDVRLVSLLLLLFRLNPIIDDSREEMPLWQRVSRWRWRECWSKMEQLSAQWILFVLHYFVCPFFLTIWRL